MVSLTSFSVSGFRAISEPLELRDLQGVVFLYGDNATGKSSVLDALRVLGRLCQTPGRELFGRPWPEEVFYERFSLDADVFNRGTSDRIQLRATTREGLEVGFQLRRSGESGEPTVEVCLLPLSQAASGLVQALSELTEAQLGIDGLDPFEDRDVVAKAEGRLEAARSLWSEALRTWEPLAVSLPSVAAVASPRLPVSDELRSRFGQGWRSRDLALRRRVHASVKDFDIIFPALGEGAIEPTDNPPRHDADVAWIGPQYPLELDHLGGGPQSAFATLAEIALAQAGIVCLEEPEAFVGERAFAGLRGAIQASHKEGVVAQVWIATHAISLARTSDSIFILDRQRGVTTATRAGPDALARFAPLGTSPSADSLGRIGVDGSVRLPSRVVSEMGLTPGEFVYVVRDDQGFRLLNGEAMQRLLDDEA